jgi:cytochrome c-type biogenesis protein CcmH
VLKRVFLLMVCLTGMAFAAVQLEPYPFTSQEDAARFSSLTQEIRCVVCQNQNIADSNAPLANDLRQKVYGMVIEKKSDNEIKDYLVKRYGQFILLKPRFNWVTGVLWVFPFLALGIVLLIIVKVVKRFQDS